MNQNTPIQYSLLPKAEFTPVPYDAGYRGQITYTNVNFYPWVTDHWRTGAAKFGISLPSNLVTRGDGRTVCEECGAVYGGYQRFCVKVVRRQILSRPDYWQDKVILGDLYHVGDDVLLPNSHNEVHKYKVREVKTEMCASKRLKWSEREEFSYQEDFFSFLESLNSIDTVEVTSVARFAQYIPHSLYGVIDSNIQRNRISQLEHENAQLKAAVNEIASRMNAAGVALTFERF